MKVSVLALLLLAALVFGLSFAIPAVDDPETPYDESESLPYEVTRPLLIIEMQPSAASQSVLPRAQAQDRLCPITASDETSAEQLQSARPHLSRSITVVNCVRRC